jgi:hypothetical protein
MFQWAVLLFYFSHYTFLFIVLYLSEADGHRSEEDVGRVLSPSSVNEDQDEHKDELRRGEGRVNINTPKLQPKFEFSYVGTKTNFKCIQCMSDLMHTISECFQFPHFSSGSISRR